MSVCAHERDQRARKCKAAPATGRAKRREGHALKEGCRALIIATRWRHQRSHLLLLLRGCVCSSSSAWPLCCVTLGPRVRAARKVQVKMQAIHAHIYPGALFICSSIEDRFSLPAIAKHCGRWLTCTHETVAAQLSLSPLPAHRCDAMHQLVCTY